MLIKHLLVFALISLLITFVNGEDWEVTVGKGGTNSYFPASFDANVGDTVTFRFVDGSHDVIQSDEFASCTKSTKAKDPFNTPINVGNAAAPPSVIWNLEAPGKLNYFCSVAEHCAKSAMYAKINVLEVGKALTEPGAKVTAQPNAGPPAQPKSGPADDQPNVQPPKTAPNATPSTSTLATPKAISSSNSLINFRNDIQLLVVTALLSLAGYFL